MKVTLRIHGRERTVKLTKKSTTENVAQPPSEGKLFEVNPLEIDRSDFAGQKKDMRQEETRQIIQDAFKEVDKHPEKYASSFYTMIPEKYWNGYKDVEYMNLYSKMLGGLTADWVEQALEWAQRIHNGESWETICNNADTARWYRIILWKNGYYRLVGGSCLYKTDIIPAADVDVSGCHVATCYGNTVPLVVIKRDIV